MKWAKILVVLVVMLSVASCSGRKCTKQDVNPSGMTVVTFGYSDPKLEYIGIADSAEVRDKQTNNLIAKAELLRFKTGAGDELEGLVVKETHFDLKKKTIYTCETTFDRMGSRITAEKEDGEKLVDAFTTWATYKRF